MVCLNVAQCKAAQCSLLPLPDPPSISQKGEKGSRKRDVYADVIQMSNEQIKWYLGIAFASQ